VSMKSDMHVPDARFPDIVARGGKAGL